MKQTVALLITTAAGVLLLAGCASSSEPYRPGQSGYLSHYHHMTPVDATTSRYVDAPRLKSYNKFKISSIDVLIKDYNGKPITPEQKARMANYIRDSITSALQDKYPVVDAPSTDTAELRVAITDVYKAGNQVGITLEGEILDSYSAVQVAAVIRNDMGKHYVGDWWDKVSAKEMVDAWALRLRQAIDSAHAQ
ncbi:MAG: DUF3313 family protein [Verrucomicrobiia bacterium]